MDAVAVTTTGLGCALGAVGVFVFNAVPARWLVDFDEEPDAERLSATRLRPVPWAVVSAALLGFVGFVAASSGRHTADALLIVAAAWVLLLASVSDARYHIIPDQAVAAIAALGVLRALLAVAATSQGWSAVTSSVLGGFVGAGSLLVLGWVAALIARREAMGFGDVKLLGALGLLVGYPGILWALMLSVLSAGCVFLVRMAAGRMERGDMAAFGPYLAVASTVYLLVPGVFDAALEAYLALLGR